MSDIELLKADNNDFEEVLDLIDLVFNSFKFETMLPAQYKEKNFMSGTNYIVKENGKIVASVGAYPVDYNVCGDNLRASGITAVAVHSRNRLNGYMKKLMEMALADMRDDNVDLSFLYGERQRYEYFGYTPCGVRLEYYCNKHNIQHYFKDKLNANIMLKEADKKDTELFDEINKIYSSKRVYVVRPRERFIDIMSTWENKTLAVYNDDRFIGYISTSKDLDSICEFFIDDVNLSCDVINAYLEKFDRYDVTISIFPYETELCTYLSKFTGTVTIKDDSNLNIINYKNILNSFLKLKCEYTKIPDGAITFNIRDTGNITITINNNIPSVMFTDEKADAVLTPLEASKLFFSPLSAYSLGPIERNAFAHNLFPIPLFVRRLDRS